MGDYLNKTTLEECKGVCSARKDCNFITHFADNWCFTYPQCDKVQPVKDIDRDSGTIFRLDQYVKIAGENATSSTGYFCKDYGFDYLDNTTLEECKGVCSARQDCNFITHFADNWCFTYKQCDNVQPGLEHMVSGTIFRRAGFQ